MDAYMYRAALYCKDCITAIKVELDWKYEGYPEAEYDSDEYPKGPYPDGGGEADSPQHCDCCHLFLENPLTGDGESYVKEALEHHGGCRSVLEDWASFYDYLVEED